MNRSGKHARATILTLTLLLAGAPVHAYDPATTHAGLTEQAVLASNLHKVLSKSAGRALGLLEPLQIHSRSMTADARRDLWARFAALDPAGGYRPDGEGVAPALAWVVAGAVLANTPPERGRHYFLDPRAGKGLGDDPGLTGFAHSVRLAVDDAATAREIATGTAFDLTGKSSIDWVRSADNELGLPVFLAQWEAAVAAPEPAMRESALVQALLALGGIVAVLQEAGEPAHVRNDFRGAYMKRQSASSWDRGSSYEQFVADRYGRTSVPRPTAVRRRPTWESFFSAPDGEGLADRTQRRFFSDGTVPRDVWVGPQSTPRDVLDQVRLSLPYAAPAVPVLELRRPGRREYLTVDGRRALAYARTENHVRFWIDDAVRADTAKALLPEIAAYGAGLVDHLTRAKLTLSRTGDTVALEAAGVAKDVRNGKLRVLVEDSKGVRKEVSRPPGALPGAGAPVTIDVPAGARRVAAVFAGDDAAGPFIAIGELTIE